MKLFDYVKSYKTGRQERFTLKDAGGNMIFSTEDIKVELQKLWFEIFNPQVWARAVEEPEIPNLKILEQDARDVVEPITRLELVNAIKQLRNGSSAGITSIHPEFLHAPEELLDVKLFKKSHI